MHKTLCVLAILAAPAFVSAAPTVALTPTEIVITLTPGASAAYIVSARGVSGSSVVSRVAQDGDGDGTIREPRPTNPSLTRHAVVVADLATREFAYTTEGVTTPGFNALPRGTILKAPAGAFTQLVLPNTGMEIVWARPGAGSWAATEDGLGNAINGMFLGDPSDFRTMPTAASAPVPASFERGDLLLVLTRGQVAFAGVVDAQIDDASPGVVSFLENFGGATEGGSITVELWRLENTSTAASVRLHVAGNAVAGVHYQPFDPVVHFAAGQMFSERTIQTLNDQVWGGAAGLTVTLGDPVNATLAADDTFALDIHENDPTPVLALGAAPAEVIETDAAAMLPILVTKQNPTRLAATARVQWKRTRFSVTEATGTIEIAFAPGETEKTIHVPLPGNDVFDGTRTIAIELEDPQGAVLGSEGRTRTVVLRDDELPRVTVLGHWMPEGFHQNIVVGRLKGLTFIDRPVTLMWRTVDGTAKAGSDYAAASGTVTSFDGDATIAMQSFQDEEIEGDEIFYIEITSATNAEIVNARAEVTIRDNSYPEVRIESPVVVEGGPGARTDVVVRLSFSRPTVIPSVLSLVRDRELYSPAAAGSDYDGSWEGVPIYVLPGRSSVDVIIPVFGDAEVEGTETLRLGTGISLGFRGTRKGILTIQSDDPGPNPTHLFVGGGGASEGLVGRAFFSVSSFQFEAGTSSVSWRTEDGTGKAGVDYVASSGTLEFTNFSPTASFQVPFIDDGDDENDETFSVVLHSPVNATIDNARATVIIYDDDVSAVPPPTLDVPGIIAGEQNGAATLTLTLSAAWPVPVIVDYRTNPPFSTGPNDFVPVSGSLTFAPGERTKTIAVPILDDPFFDPNEKIFVVLSSGIAKVPAEPVPITIDDDEPILRRRAARP